MDSTTLDATAAAEAVKLDGIAVAKPAKPKAIKVVVWDLDNTVWDGTLLEDERVELRPGVREIIETLDARGILQSVASKNEPTRAMDRLKALGIDEFFLHPRIDWNAKGQNVLAIQKALNVGIDTFLFVDDQPFEREEVQFTAPQVRTWDASNLSGLLELPELNPEFLTDDARTRRLMYMADFQRQQAEEEFSGPTEEFLATLQMRFTLASCSLDDLQRAEELTVRTNQLNTTGYTYDYDELNAFRTSDHHLLMVAGLEDKYGTYGKIGLCLVEKAPDFWTIKLLLMSCRVMSRGVGTIMMSHVMQQAKAAGAKLRAEFKPNGRNRMMFVTYKFGGFKEVAQHGDLVIFEHDLETVQPFPPYVHVQIG